MSAGVSDQRIKGQGNQGKNVEERSIPWSQQVDEAFEVVSSPTEVNVQGSTNTGGTQFQYPPFNSKDNNTGPDHYQGGNRRNNNIDDGCNQSSSNNFSRKYENEQQSANSKNHLNLNHNHSRKTTSYDDSYRSAKNNLVHRTNNDKVNIQRGLQHLSIDNHERTINKGYVSSESSNNVCTNNNKNNSKTSNTEQQHSSTTVKQTTWASIASQPAKPTLRSNLISSTLKKKGPGMPPPPMVPGKHNMDINTWDTPKNGPILVPPPLPPIIPIPVMETSIFNQSKTSLNEDRSGTANNEIESQKSKCGPENSEQSGNRNSNNNWASCQSQNKMIERSIQHQSTRGNSNEINERPPWVPQYQQQHHSHYHNQNQSSAHHQLNTRNLNPNNSSRGGDDGNMVHYRHDSTSSSSQFTNISQVDPLLRNSPTPSNSSSTIAEVHQEQRLNLKNYNPQELDIDKASLARFFVIKSYSEDDIYRSIKYEIWCSTDRGNIRLDDAFEERQRERGFVYLLFSVNGSGHFCGIAQMMSNVDYDSVSNVWSQKKWKGTFKVKWLYVKDVKNSLFRHITIEANENKPVTHSRDTQEVPNNKGILVMKIIHEHKHTTTLIEDFSHYEKRQEEEKVIKKHELPSNVGTGTNRSLHRSGEFGRGDNYDSKNNSYQRDRKNYNRTSFQNSYDNRRNDNERNLRDNGSSPVNQNNNRENNSGDYYNSRSSGFRNNYSRRDERNDDNISNSGENRGLSGKFFPRTDNRSYSFRDRERESYKRKSGWRSNQRSIELNEKAEN